MATTSSTAAPASSRKRIPLGGIAAVAIVLTLLYVGYVTHWGSVPPPPPAAMVSAPVPIVASIPVPRPSCTANDVWAKEAAMIDWPKFELSTGQASPRIKKCVGTHLRWYGNVILHAVYADGTDCAMMPGTKCPDGAETEEYVVNASDERVTTGYALAREGEP